MSSLKFMQGSLYFTQDVQVSQVDIGGFLVTDLDMLGERGIEIDCVNAKADSGIDSFRTVKRIGGLQDKPLRTVREKIPGYYHGPCRFRFHADVVRVAGPGAE